MVRRVSGAAGRRWHPVARRRERIENHPGAPGSYPSQNVPFVILLSYARTQFISKNRNTNLRLDLLFATGDIPDKIKRSGRPSPGVTVPLIKRRALKTTGRMRYEACARFVDQSIQYLAVFDSEAEALECCRKFIATGIAPAKPVRTVTPQKPKADRKKSGPKPKVAHFPKPNPSGADRWREIFKQRCA